MRETLARRTSLPGSTITFGVLASGRRTSIGIDLDSGAFVRAAEPVRRPLHRPLSVMSGVTIATTIDRPEHPELVQFGSPLQTVDRLHGWKAERMLRSAEHPKHRPLLGFNGPSAPWWELETTGPSVGLLAPEGDPIIRMTERGLRCRFPWSDHLYDLPLEDPRVLSRLDWLPNSPVRMPDLVRVLGFRPTRLVVALGKPVRGYCPKVVVGFVPSA